jgi:hypothetical protein
MEDLPEIVESVVRPEIELPSVPETAEVPPLPETVVALPILVENQPENSSLATAPTVETEVPPELVPLPRVKESAPPRLATLPTEDSAENHEAEPTAGPPVWLMVVGLGLLLIVGIVLVSFALK